MIKKQNLVMKKKLTKIEKLDVEISRWLPFFEQEKERLREYPVQSRKALRAMRTEMSLHKERFWDTHTLLCIDLGIHAYICEGQPCLCGFIPKQSKMSSNWANLVIYQDTDVRPIPL